MGLRMTARVTLTAQLPVGPLGALSGLSPRRVLHVLNSVDLLLPG